MLKSQTKLQVKEQGDNAFQKVNSNKDDAPLPVTHVRGLSASFSPTINPRHSAHQLLGVWLFHLVEKMKKATYCILHSYLLWEVNVGRISPTPVTCSLWATYPSPLVTLWCLVPTPSWGCLFVVCFIPHLLGILHPPRALYQHHLSPWDPPQWLPSADKDAVILKTKSSTSSLYPVSLSSYGSCLCSEWLCLLLDPVWNLPTCYKAVYRPHECS